jgi:hypothetical protein
VLSDDGFASIPWYSGVDEIRAVWGEPNKTEQVYGYDMEIVVYRGLPIDHPMTFTVFGVHRDDGLLVGNLVMFVSDSLTTETVMSDWTVMVSSLRGKPDCATDESNVELPVAKNTSWCAARDPDCDCDRAAIGVLARYGVSLGHGLVALISVTPEFDSRGSQNVDYFDAVLSATAALISE